VPKEEKAKPAAEDKPKPAVEEEVPAPPKPRGEEARNLEREELEALRRQLQRKFH